MNMTTATATQSELLEKYLRDSHVLNLATCVNNRPSNRDVFYLMPDEFTNYIYITTPRNSNKMAEIEANPRRYQPMMITESWRQIRRKFI